jgi:2-polyprenyl-3-methyl-5-hydroxy-6-metoxy-1,4-benzoquinol methylase
MADLIISVVKTLEDVRTICDLGCGNGYLSCRLAGLGYHVTGIDASQSGIAFAKQSCPSDKIEFICAFLENDLSDCVNNRQFDLVISSDVIEHLYRPVDLILAAYNLLKPTGHLIIGTPYHGYLKNLALSILNQWDAHHCVHWDGGHIKFFSVRTFRSLIEGQGFADIRFSFYGRFLWLWKNMICHARKRT